jgi:hypothetical protein
MLPSAIERRRFLSLAGAAPLIGSALPADPIAPLPVASTIGGLREDTGEPPIPSARRFFASAEGAGFEYRLAPGALTGRQMLVCDMLLDGDTAAFFQITLEESAAGRVFRFSFGGLNRCSFRVRMALSLVDQNRWQSDREGAFLKPLAGGDRVDPAKVDRATFTLRRKGPQPVHWSMTPLAASATEVEKLAAPALPAGPLLDRFGQFRLKSWAGKTTGEDELKRRIAAQHERAPEQKWPETYSRWGGSNSTRLGPASGFFRTHHDGKRWWLVDPDGYAFWSAGADCVRVDCDARYDGIETALEWLPERGGPYADALGREGGHAKFVNYLAANIIRALGPQGWRDKWAAIALAEMRRLRFNTVGNWSEFDYARKARFPYVRPLEFAGSGRTRAPMIYRDFPDVFHADFERDVDAYASALAATADDPALIGYFLMNEPTWGFSSEVPAAGMLFTSEANATRDALARTLGQKYGGDAALAAAWKLPVTLQRVARGRWTGQAIPRDGAAAADLRAFSVVMVERYFRTLSAACRKVDPHHLNLGMRWAGVPPEWAVAGMKFFDVFSINCYMDKVPRDRTTRIREMLNRPVLVGEWHFGALDVGLPASGIGHLRNQVERAKAYRVYLEDAAANPDCVGTHWFTLYDESALGRFDGENYNIGFLDICNRPYQEMCAAAVSSHEHMYAVAAGRQPPFAADLEYLPKLFI